MVAVSKLYNILNKRLSAWFRPDLELAGALEGSTSYTSTADANRYSLQMNKDLYVAYLEYEKAYDCIDQNKLLEVMAGNGCGERFLNAIYNSLRTTQQIIS